MEKSIECSLYIIYDYFYIALHLAVHYINGEEENCPRLRQFVYQKTSFFMPVHILIHSTYLPIKDGIV